MLNSNGALWARLRFYLSVGALIGAVVAGSFTIFETQADHDADVNRILKNQERIMNRLDQLYFKNNTGLVNPLYHLPEPKPGLLLAS